MIEIRIPEFPEEEFQKMRRQVGFVVPEVAALWAWNRAYVEAYQAAVRDHVLDKLGNRMDERMEKMFSGKIGEQSQEDDE